MTGYPLASFDIFGYPDKQDIWISWDILQVVIAEAAGAAVGLNYSPLNRGLKKHCDFHL